MSEPSRYIGSGGLKGRLLASAKQDRPPKGSQRRAILAAAAAAAASTQAGSATALGTLGRWAVWKWIAVGAVGAGSVVAAKAVILPPPDTSSITVSPPTPPGAPALRARRAPATVLPSPSDSASAETLSPSPLPLANPTKAEDVVKTMLPPPVATAREVPKTEARIASAESAATTSPVSTPSSTLSSEIAAIDHAKRALAYGNAGEALRRIDVYDAAFPNGTLAAEATALRVEALARAGHLDESRAALARLRANHPESPLLENLARIVGE
jgi:hypothetical protein